MEREGIKGVFGTYSAMPLEKIEDDVFSGCPVKVTSRTPMEYNGKNAIVVGFEIRDARMFPTLLENYHGCRQKYELNLTVFVGTKKVNLEALR